MKLILTLGTALVLAPLVHAGVGYLRPEISYVAPTDSEADGTIGLSVAAGMEFGEDGRHAVELEGGWARWDLSTTVMGTALAVEGTHTVTPVLVNYRLSMPLGEDLRGYIQVGAGFARSKIDWSGPDLGDYDDTGLAYAAGLGLRWQVAPRATVAVGYRYLAVDTLNWRFTWDEGEGGAGFAILSNESDAHMLGLAVQFTF